MSKASGPSTWMTCTLRVCGESSASRSASAGSMCETIWTVVGAVRRTWLLMVSAVVSEVSRNVDMGGGVAAAISAINPSSIGPGPDGIAPTRPRASAPARIAMRIGDVFIRNVTTDIRRYFMDDSSGEMIKDGNSIFIFEVARLCIGHLGHLHHKLDDSHFAAIGRLDILMVPIDGAYTMSLDGISEITRRLRASVVLPMHRFATPLDEFMRKIGQQFEIDERTERSLTISRDSLPAAPTVVILRGV